MRILIFGLSGMLGHKLYQQLSPHFETFGTIRGGFDAIERYGIFDADKTVVHLNAENIESVEKALNTVRPDVVINAVGIIKQLPNAKNVIKSLTINSIFPNQLGELTEKYGYRFITISTDCVFDGQRGLYNENDLPNATDVYGKSKNLGEVTGSNCLTVRTSIIGRELTSEHSLVEWVLSNRGKQINGYRQAIYSGFPTIVFADIISSLITEHPGLSGLYHVASTPISKYELIGLINKHYDAGIEIVPSDEFQIDRSLDASRFNALTGFRPQPWDEMIRKMAADKTPYDNWK